MARVSPEEAAQKWASRTAAAAQDYARGVQRVQTAPGALAARQSQKYLARVQQNVQKWQHNVSRVSLGEWQQAAVEKGAQRLATGVQQSQGKMAAYMAEALPHIDRGLAQLQQMPSLTLEDSKARAAFWIDHMSRFRRGGGGR